MITSRSQASFKGTDVHNLFCSNTREQKKLESQIKKMSSTTRFQMNKIDREMFELRKQLIENQKILGTRSDTKRRQNIDFTSDEKLDLRAETPRLGMTDCQGKFRGTRRHSISDVDATAHEKRHQKINSARFIVREPSPSSSEDTEEKKTSFNKLMSYPLTRRRQSISALPSYDKALLCNRGEKSGVLGFDQTHNRGTGKSQVEHEKERHVTSWKCSRRHSLPCHSFTNVQEKFSRKNETKNREETAHLAARTKSHKNSPHDSKSLGVQTQQRPNSIFQRRHSTPNYMLPLNREQKDKMPLVVTRSRGSINKLTAKLPTRVATARIREPVAGKKVCQTIESIELRKPPTVEENAEKDTEDEEEGNKSEAQHKENSSKEVSEEKQENKKEEEEDKDKEQELASGYGEDETKTPPDELCGIPKITLEEKIEKFFAGAIELEVAGKISGHYAEVLEMYLSEKDED